MKIKLILDSFKSYRINYEGVVNILGLFANQFEKEVMELLLQSAL